MRAEYALVLIVWVGVVCYLVGEHAGREAAYRELRARRQRTRIRVRQSLARPW